VFVQDHSFHELEIKCGLLQVRSSYYHRSNSISYSLEIIKFSVNYSIVQLKFITISGFDIQHFYIFIIQDAYRHITWGGDVGRTWDLWVLVLPQVLTRPVCLWCTSIIKQSKAADAPRLRRCDHSSQT